MTEHSYNRNLQGDRYCGYLWRLGIALIVVGAVFARSSPAQEPADSVEFDLPQQSLASALLSFSEQANVQVIADASVIDGIQCARVSGSMPVEVALKALLDATGLTYAFSSARTVSVFLSGGAKRRKTNVDTDDGSSDSAKIRPVQPP